MKTENEKYCANCGTVIDKRAEICPKCGVRQPGSSPFGFGSAYDPEASDKDWLITLILCICLGYLGVHRFYTGSILYGILQLVTFGGCGIWTIIDFVLIITNKFKDGEGRLVVSR